MDLTGVRYGAQIAAAAARHHIDPQLLAAVAAQETGGPGSNSGNNVVGDGGHGHGVFQIDDRSWAFARTPAAMDPASNADMAASILHDNLQRYGGDTRQALSAYNSGSPTAAGTSTTWADGRTLSYAASVLRHYENLGADPHGQLVADNRATASSVNALATLGGMQPAPMARAAPAAVPPAAAAVAPANASVQLGAPQVPPFVPSPAPQTASNSASAAATNAQTEADHGFASMLDTGDVFDDPAADG